MPVAKPRLFALEELLRPLEINYDRQPETRRIQARRRRRDVLTVYPFLTADEQKRADEWFAHYEQKLLALVE